jgi:excisionase family DNA binding protein
LATYEEDGDYVTVADIAASCGISKMTIYRMIAAGQIAARKIDRRLLILATDAKTYLGVEITRLPVQVKAKGCERQEAKFDQRTSEVAADREVDLNTTKRLSK